MFLPLLILAILPQKPVLISSVNTENEMALHDALKLINLKFNISIVADYFEEEEKVRFTLANTADESLNRIASLSHREQFKFPSIIILRHRNWARLNQIKVTQSDANQDIASVFELQIHRAMQLSSWVPVADSISVKAPHISVGNLVNRLRKESAQICSVDPSIAQRQVTIFAEKVAPISLLTGIGLIVNAGPEINLKQSVAQQKLEAYEASLPQQEPYRERMRRSDALREELERHLTTSQKQALAKQETVALHINELPESLKKQALEYVNASARLYGDRVSTPDIGRVNEFYLNFMPTSAGEWHRMLGVVMLGSDGQRYVF